jgi:DNA-directed RNA polymerase specialized sigma24 family protein
MRTKGATIAELEAIYKSRFHMFVGLATALLRDGEAGFDVVQDAFVAAVENRHQFRRTGSLEGWLWGITINRIRDRQREVRPRLRAGDALQTSYGGNGHLPEGVGLPTDFFADLAERERLVLFLRYYADLDYAAIASALAVAPGTVAATLNRAHSKLRRRLEEVSDVRHR